MHMNTREVRFSGAPTAMNKDSSKKRKGPENPAESMRKYIDYFKEKLAPLTDEEKVPFFTTLYVFLKGGCKESYFWPRVSKELIAKVREAGRDQLMMDARSALANITANDWWDEIPTAEREAFKTELLALIGAQ